MTRALTPDRRARLREQATVNPTALLWQGQKILDLLDALEQAEAMHAEAFRIGIAKQEQIKAVESLLEQTDRVARANQHLARLSTREIRDALYRSGVTEAGGDRD